jgi:hypothetical protein
LHEILQAKGVLPFIFRMTSPIVQPLPARTSLVTLASKRMAGSDGMASVIARFFFFFIGSSPINDKPTRLAFATV